MNRLTNISSWLRTLCSILIIMPLTATSIWAANKPLDETIEQIHVNADHMKLNTNTGSSTYTGNVIITQGKRILTGDKVTIVQKNDLLQRITIVGQPAHFSDTVKDQGMIKATSLKMVYLEHKNRLTLTGNAELKQTEHIVNSEKIIYDTLTGTIIAGKKMGQSDNKTSPVKQHERVNITLTPQPH